MNYYIIYNGQQVGPMPKEQLVAYGLNPTSKVWCEGMPNWADASTVVDLHPLLYPQQPPMPPYQGGYQQQPPYQQPPYQGGYQQQPYQGGYQQHQPYQGGYQQQPYGGQPAYYNEPQEIGFGDAIKICFKKYADFEGRARRSEFWWWYLFTFLVGLVPYLGWIASLAFLLPSIAVGVRRLHDTGRSGWLYLLTLIPCVGSIILIIWWCEDSQGDNEYGPSPKYPGE